MMTRTHTTVIMESQIPEQLTAHRHAGHDVSTESAPTTEHDTHRGHRVAYRYG